MPKKINCCSSYRPPSTCFITKNLTFLLTSVDAIKLDCIAAIILDVLLFQTQSSDWEIKHPIKDYKIVIKRTRCKLYALFYSLSTRIYFKLFPLFSRVLKKLSPEHCRKMQSLVAESVSFQYDLIGGQPHRATNEVSKIFTKWDVTFFKIQVHWKLSLGRFIAMPCSIGSNYILDVGAVLAKKRGICLEKANSIYAKVSLCCETTYHISHFLCLTFVRI